MSRRDTGSVRVTASTWRSSAKLLRSVAFAISSGSIGAATTASVPAAHGPAGNVLLDGGIAGETVTCFHRSGVLKAPTETFLDWGIPVIADEIVEGARSAEATSAGEGLARTEDPWRDLVGFRV
jgi:hypothetical protein